MLLPNSSVPCPCPELSCGLSSSGAVWEEQENPRGSQSPAELWEGPCAPLWIWGGRCLAGRGVVTPGCPLPRCHCPCALCCSCPVGPTPPAPYHEVPFGTPPCPTLCVSILAFPRHCQLEMVIPALTASLDQWGPMSSTGSGLQQLWWLQTRPQMSPCWMGVAGNAEPSRGQLCLDPCASSLDIICPLSVGTGLGMGTVLCVPSRYSSLSLVTFPCGWNCLCPSRAIPGTAELLEALQEGSAVSVGSPRRNFHLWGMSRGPPPRHKHFPLR
ncbi:hypothetical protein Nmel_012048 [Mimus melanotis]